jgi:peptide deformylase
MSLLEIKKYPNPILRKKAEDIKEITPEIKELAKNMIETMEKADGVGLAGPQVGISKKIIAVQTENGPSVFLNPKILKRFGKKIKMKEGCLSVPNILVEVKRKDGIKVRVLTLEGKDQVIEAKGFQSRIFQHEIDHLNGIMIIDKLGFLKKLKIKKQLK